MRRGSLNRFARSLWLPLTRGALLALAIPVATRPDLAKVLAGTCRSLFQFVGFFLIFEFEEVGDIEECVALEADVDKCRLHAGQNAGYAAVIDRPRQGVFVFAFVIDFRELIVFKIASRVSCGVLEIQISFAIVPFRPAAIGGRVLRQGWMDMRENRTGMGMGEGEDRSAAVASLRAPADVAEQAVAERRSSDCREFVAIFARVVAKLLGGAVSPLACAWTNRANGAGLESSCMLPPATEFHRDAASRSTARFVQLMHCKRYARLCVLMNPILPGCGPSGPCRRKCFKTFLLQAHCALWLSPRGELVGCRPKVFPCRDASVHEPAHADIHRHAQRQERKQHRRSAVTH